METIVKRLFDNRRINESATTTAWHLRQDGKAFPVKVHMYSEEDDTLASQAEVAAFIIKSQSRDIGIAEQTLDAWMALLIEESVSYDADEDAINESIVNELSNLPYKFQYSLSSTELLAIHNKCQNFNNIDTLYDFIDEVREDLDTYIEDMKESINQQFCRVRYGGQYDTSAGDSEIWFRISSKRFNWANTIYQFVSNMRKKLNLSHITICRDLESDGSESEYFYKAKDGATYYHMPIKEFLDEEHEHSLVFESMTFRPRACEGVLHMTKKAYEAGYTTKEIQDIYKRNNIQIHPSRYNSHLLSEELHRCVKEGI